MLPECTQVGAVGVGKIVEYLKNRFADDQRLDHLDTESYQRMFKSEFSIASVVSGTVSDGQNFPGHAGIFGDQFRQRGHSNFFSLTEFNQFQQNLRHCRQARYQQAMTNIRFFLAHYIRPVRRLTKTSSVYDVRRKRPSCSHLTAAAPCQSFKYILYARTITKGIWRR